MSPALRRLLLKIHRWGGLMLAAFIVFYAITGILLNHRRFFHYFIHKEKETYRVPVSDTRRLREFIDFYKAQIHRQDDPTVIKIRSGNVIEFLYGSHGKTTYVIFPASGKMIRVEKKALQPWSWMNRLHKAFKTSSIWVVFSDLASIFLMVVTISGLLIFKYRKADYLFLLMGSVIIVIAMIFAY